MSEDSDFLYPFIEAGERDAGPLLADLAASATAKAAHSRDLRAAHLRACAADIERVADSWAGRFGAGGRLLVFGNGGSATDAGNAAALFLRPPWGRPLPALSLATEPAVITALGNDVGFDLVFSRQVIAHARPGDMALGLSTSGNSPDLMTAFAEAARRGLATLGLAGGGGGRMAASPDVACCLVVDSDSIHRIQETQAALVFALWAAVQGRLSPVAAR